MRPFSFLGQREWRDYLLADDIGSRVGGDLRDAARGTQHALSVQTRELVASNEALKAEFSDRFDELNGSVSLGLRGIAESVGAIGGSIEALRAEFDYGLGLIVDQLQVANETLLTISRQLDRIYAALATPMRTQAREHFNEACALLGKGLLDKAIEYFLRAEATYDADFFTHFQIGKLYLYGKDEDDDVVDLTKAETHLLLAIRYGKAELGRLPDMARVTAEAMLHASVASCAQARDAWSRDRADTAVGERLEQARRLAREAASLHGSLSEAHYQAAKCSSLMGDEDAAIAELESAIRIDWRYCIKADADVDIRQTGAPIIALFARLRDEARGDAVTALDGLLALWTDPTAVGRVDAVAARAHLGRARDAMARAPYRDCRALVEIAPEVEKRFAHLLRLASAEVEDERCATLWEAVRTEIATLLDVLAQPFGATSPRLVSSMGSLTRLETALEERVAEELRRRKAASDGELAKLSGDVAALLSRLGHSRSEVERLQGEPWWDGQLLAVGSFLGFCGGGVLGFIWFGATATDAELHTPGAKYCMHGCFSVADSRLAHLSRSRAPSGWRLLGPGRSKRRGPRSTPMGGSSSRQRSDCARPPIDDGRSTPRTKRRRRHWRRTGRTSEDDGVGRFEIERAHRRQQG